MEFGKPLQHESDYDAALERITVLMDDLSGPEGQIEDDQHPSRIELDALVDLVQAYESVHYPIEQPSAAPSAER